MKTHWRIPCFAIFAILLFPACYQPGGPIPEAPVPPAPREPIPQMVIVEEELVYSPYPRENGVIPPEHDHECDYIHFLRYRPETPDGSIKEVNAVLVLMVIYSGGNNQLDYLGRQVVSMAENDPGVGSLEVWALDRRPNCLEDLSGMNDAEAAENPKIAREYYYDLEGNGTDFHGFLTSDEVPFLSEFGLELVMKDIQTVVTAKIPNQDDRKNTVFIGGNGGGAILTATYVGWDFDGNPDTEEDAGFQNCAGLIGLDTPVQCPLDSDHPWYNLWWENEPISETEYVDRLRRIQTGEKSRLEDLQLLGISPSSSAAIEIAAMAAAFRPDEEATGLRDPKLAAQFRAGWRLNHSRDLAHYLFWLPEYSDFRLTNEAHFGMIFDDNFQANTILQASVGFLQGGPVVVKTFWDEFLTVWGFLFDLFGLPDLTEPEGKFIPWDAGPSISELGTGPVYSWVNFDEVGDASDPVFQDVTGSTEYTTMGEEVTDIQDWARVFYRGPSNAMEWYFPARLPLDVKGVVGEFETTDPCSSYGLCLLHPTAAEEFRAQGKIKEFLTDHHPNPDPNLSGYDVVDVLAAAVDRPSHRPNEVFAPLMQWVFDHSGGTVVPLD